MFCISWISDHKKCDADQFKIEFDYSGKYVQYILRVTKNVQDGLKHCKIEITPLQHYEDENNPRCLVRPYEKYLFLIPRVRQLYGKPLDSTATRGPRFRANTNPVYQISQIFKKFNWYHWQKYF